MKKWNLELYCKVVKALKMKIFNFHKKIQNTCFYIFHVNLSIMIVKVYEIIKLFTVSMNKVIIIYY